METVLKVSDANERFGAGRVRHRVASGRWQRPWRGVVVTHNGTLTRTEHIAVILAASPPGSAIGGPTALELDGFTGFAESAIHIVLPDGRHRPNLPSCRVHWSQHLETRTDVHPLRHPRRTTAARSVVDFASWCTADRYARAIVLASFQQGLVNARTLREALARRGPCKRRALIMESMLDAVGGVQSLPERDFDWIRSVLGLPPPTRQRKVKGRDGHYYLDVHWDEFDLTVEIHGTPHREVQRWSADLVRANEVAITGERQLAFSSFAVRRERWLVADQLARMARACGWQGLPPSREQFQRFEEMDRQIRAEVRLPRAP